MQGSEGPIHSAQLEFHVQFWTLYFKKDEFISERLKDRKATSISDLKNLIYKGKLAGWKSFLQEQSKNNALKVMLALGFQRRGRCFP